MLQSVMGLTIAIHQPKCSGHVWVGFLNHFTNHFLREGPGDLVVNHPYKRIILCVPGLINFLYLGITRMDLE